MRTANARAILVNTTATVHFQVHAKCVVHDEPTVFIFIGTDALVRNLPEQNFEIIFRAWCIDLLGNVGAAGRIGAEIAFLSAIELSIDFDFGEIGLIHRINVTSPLVLDNIQSTQLRDYQPQVENYTASSLPAVTT